MGWEPVVYQYLELMGMATTVYAMSATRKNTREKGGESMVMRGG